MKIPLQSFTKFNLEIRVLSIRMTFSEEKTIKEHFILRKWYTVLSSFER